MKVYHIGTISCETNQSGRELKAIGGISGYIKDLIDYSLINNIKIGLIGKIFNYEELAGIDYIKIQDKISSTNRFLVNLTLKSITSRIPQDVIIHAHRPDHLAAFYFFSRRKSIVTLHGQQARTVSIRKNGLTRLIYRALENYSFKKALALIAVDSITNNYYSNLYPRYKHKILKISTGVNTELFKPMDKSPCREELGFKASDKIVVYVGRVEPPKRLDIIIKAFEKLVSKDTTYKLAIVGDGVSMNGIKKMVEDLVLNENVYFMGVRKRIELPKIFCAADISVLISDNEGSPLSVKESLACGVPVVANDVGDISEIVKSQHNGFIVNPNDLDEIVQKLAFAASNSSAMKSACLESVKDFSIETVNHKVLQLYNTVFNEG
ncbi:MAG TPA: glycosyltransferase family 4 protein [Tenuifilaceae bacterium]|nr:glycosyltransferase family 4 protein [Tenuifilaceae bacterium]